MAHKNNPEKFTVQFNSADPCHLQTIDILNAQGRRKAQFIVNAIMHYIYCPETPDIPHPTTDTALIEGIVRRILQEQGAHSSTANTSKTPARTIRKSENLDFTNADEILGAEGIATIAKTMASFRHS